MKILHCSDNHGNLNPLLGKFDIAVCSGDWIPNEYRADKKMDAIFQEQWIYKNEHEIRMWVGTHKFLFVCGNHERINPVEALCKIGVNAIDLNEKIVTIDCLNFYGMPYVPWFGGEWNNELDANQMAEKMDQLSCVVNDCKIDVLVMHCPPHGVLDENHFGEHIGNSFLTNAINYKFEHMPTLLLCGHCHETPYISNLNGMTISNAATTQHIIEI